LAIIPDNWDLTYGSGLQIIQLDTSVTHNGHVSIRLDPHTAADANIYRECDTEWRSIQPGDHIIIRVWIKTSHSTLGHDGDGWYGARVGVDMAGNGHVVYSRPFGGQEHYDMNVPFGTDAWTLRQWDFTVPNTYFTTDLATGAGILPTQISSFGLWLQVLSVDDGGVGWFADAELYINP
jgi:hypothetical protein